MATLDRKVPSPNTFLYKPWSAFVEAVKLQNSDTHVEDTGKDFGNGREARKLSREDMPLYGQYPAHDQLCLVVCNICSLVVKPQSFLSHYERRHAPSCEPRLPRVSHSSPLQPLSVYPPKGPRGKPCVSVPVVSLEKMWCLGRGEGPHVRISCPPTSSSSSSSSPGSVRPPHRPQDRQLNGRGPPTPLPSPSRSPSALDKRPSPSPTSLDRRPTPTPSPSSSLDRQPPAPPPPLDRKHQNGTKPYKRVSGRVFDPNKHCGVLDPEGRKPCTRSLTCKTHSLTHRRAVPGRVKQFDSLLAEHKGRHLREQQGSHARPSQSQEPSSSSSSSAVTDSHEARSTSLLKSRLANAHIPRVPAGWSSVAQSPCVGPPPDSVAPGPGAEGGERVSSEEGEVEPPEDLDCPCSSHHPRPMGCCAFGGRLMGRGYYVFDRRRDRLRLALRCMVEKHVSTHMWRKIPLAAESRTPHSGAPLAPPPLAPPSSLPPPLLPSPAPPTPSNSVSMVTYSTAFPHVGATGGVFSIVDSASLLPPVPALAPMYPSPPRQPRPRPTKPPKACDLPPRGGWAVGEVTGSKRRKSPLSSSSSSSSSSFTGPLRGNCHAPLPPPSPHQPSPAISSNGTAPLCAKAPPPGHALPRPLPFSGDHALFARADGRKRKSSSPVGRPGKTPKPAPLNTIYRPPGSEPPHPTLPRQPKVHH